MGVGWRKTSQRQQLEYVWAGTGSALMELREDSGTEMAESEEGLTRLTEWPVRTATSQSTMSLLSAHPYLPSGSLHFSPCDLPK